MVPEHLKRDHDQRTSDYHILRGEIDDIVDRFKSVGKSALLYGDICDGKSLILRGVADRLFGIRPVFVLQHSYDDLLSEVSSIYAAYPEAILLLENCFALREDRLLSLAKIVSAGSGNLLMTARSISTEAESGKLKGLRAVPGFAEIPVGRLSGTEIEAFVDLIDQIAGWAEFRALSRSERRRFIEEDCRGVVPNVLLKLLGSSYVRDRYLEEFNKLVGLDPLDRRMILSALLVSNIGFDAPVSFVSDLFERDFSSAIQRAERMPGGLRLLRVEGGVAKTVPSIGARNLLRNVISDKDVVDATIFMLERISSYGRRSDFQQTVFSQLMRYSILSSSVQDPIEINRFFDHISKISHFRDMPLFWLQWHMAMCSQDRWVDAEKYLAMGYTAADAHEKRRDEKYSRKHLDDRKAKFLAARARSMLRSGSELFRDLKESFDIASRLLRSAELTHHPFETLRDIGRLYAERGSTIADMQRQILSQQFMACSSHGRKRLREVPEGYQRSHATAALDEFDILIKANGSL